MVTNPKVLFTDGEGPLVFKDLARDIGTRFEDGQFFFDTISLYNGFLAETRGPNFPGDTLSLWVPHLIAHGLTDEDLYDESKNTTLANGAENYLRLLRENGWEIRLISTAYRHLWEIVSSRLGIKPQHISSSDISLKRIHSTFWNPQLQDTVISTESQILSMRPHVLAAQRAFRNGADIRDIFTEIDAMRKVGARLDHFYLTELPGFGFNPFRDVPTLNARRKVEAVVGFCRELGIKPQGLIYIGDSITDDLIHRFVRENGGLAIAENGDRFALRNANLAIALEDACAKIHILESWIAGGWEGVKDHLESGPSIARERELGPKSQVTVDFLDSGCDIERVVEIHTLFKKKLRGDAIPLW